MRRTQDCRRTVTQLSDHARVVVGRELVEQMTHITRIGALSFAHSMGLGDPVCEARICIGLPDRVERFQRLFRFAGLEPRFAEMQPRICQCRVETQCPLEFADGRRQMTCCEQRFAQSHRGHCNARIERSALARGIESRRRIAGRDERTHQTVVQQKSAATLLQHGLQQGNRVTRAALRNQRIGTFQRIVRMQACTCRC